MKGLGSDFLSFSTGSLFLALNSLYFSAHFAPQHSLNLSIGSLMLFETLYFLELFGF